MCHNYIHPSAVVHKNAIIGENTSVGPFAVVEDNVFIGNNTKIGPHCIINSKTIIGNNCEISGLCNIGSTPNVMEATFDDRGYTIIDNNCIVKSYSNIDAPLNSKNLKILEKLHTLPTNQQFIKNLIHPIKSIIPQIQNKQIIEFLNQLPENNTSTLLKAQSILSEHCHLAHDCNVGPNAVIMPYNAIGGHVVVKSRAFISICCTVSQKITLGEYSFCQAYCPITKNVPPFVYIKSTTPKRIPEIKGINKIGIIRNFPQYQSLQQLKKCYLDSKKEKNKLEKIKELKTKYNNDAMSSQMLNFMVDFHPPKSP